jgi:hypothetical protein
MRVNTNSVRLLTKMYVDPAAANFCRMGEFPSFILCKK